MPDDYRWNKDDPTSPIEPTQEPQEQSIEILERMKARLEQQLQHVNAALAKFKEHR